MLRVSQTRARSPVRTLRHVIRVVLFLLSAPVALRKRPSVAHP